MSENWDSSDEAIVDNPIGVKRGWSETRSIYESIFGSSGIAQLEF